MDAIWIEGQDVSLMKMSYDEMKKKFKHDYEKPSYGSGWLSENHSLKDWFTKFYQGKSLLLLFSKNLIYGLRLHLMR